MRFDPGEVDGCDADGHDGQQHESDTEYVNRERPDAEGHRPAAMTDGTSLDHHRGLRRHRLALSGADRSTGHATSLPGSRWGGGRRGEAPTWRRRSRHIWRVGG